jgi:hypothetical protein
VFLVSDHTRQVSQQSISSLTSDDLRLGARCICPVKNGRVTVLFYILIEEKEKLTFD